MCVRQNYVKRWLALGLYRSKLMSDPIAILNRMSDRQAKVIEAQKQASLKIERERELSTPGETVQPIPPLLPTPNVPDGLDASQSSL